ncbi:MAG: hypothetical protein IT372_22325 [Polyangiaceae bacterium]|nr:hypothetical protein [Polyangiaceae bacterium]
MKDRSSAFVSSSSASAGFAAILLLLGPFCGCTPGMHVQATVAAAPAAACSSAAKSSDGAARLADVCVEYSGNHCVHAVVTAELTPSEAAATPCR